MRRPSWDLSAVVLFSFFVNLNIYTASDSVQPDVPIVSLPDLRRAQGAIEGPAPVRPSTATLEGSNGPQDMRTR